MKDDIEWSHGEDKENKKEASKVILESVPLLYGSGNKDGKHGYVGDRIINQAWWCGG